jgi:hypothetical protein
MEEAMFKSTLIAAALAGATLAASTANAGEFGSLMEARQMLDRAIAKVKSDKEAAIDLFNHNKAPFRDRDLFVFCFNAYDGKLTAHEAFVTRNVRDLHDLHGNAYGEDMFAAPREGEVAEVAYVAPVPGSTDQAEKVAFISRAGDQVCGVSAYVLDGPQAMMD